MIYKVEGDTIKRQTLRVLGLIGIASFLNFIYLACGENFKIHEIDHSSQSFSAHQCSWSPVEAESSLRNLITHSNFFYNEQLNYTGNGSTEWKFFVRYNSLSRIEIEVIKSNENLNPPSAVKEFVISKTNTQGAISFDADYTLSDGRKRYARTWIKADLLSGILSSLGGGGGMAPSKYIKLFKYTHTYTTPARTGEYDHNEAGDFTLTTKALPIPPTGTECDFKFGTGVLSENGECVPSRCNPGFTLDCNNGNCSPLAHSTKAFCRRLPTTKPAHTLGAQKTLVVFVRDPDKQFTDLRSKEKALESLDAAANIISQNSHGRMSIEVIDSIELLTTEDARNTCINGTERSQPRLASLIADYVFTQFDSLPHRDQIDLIAIFNHSECNRGNNGSIAENGVKYISMNSWFPGIVAHELGHSLGSNHHWQNKVGLSCLDAGVQPQECVFGGSGPSDLDIMGSTRSLQFSAPSKHEWGWMDQVMTFPESVSSWQGTLIPVEEKPAAADEYHLLRFRTPTDKVFPGWNYFNTVDNPHYYTFEYSKTAGQLIVRGLNYRTINYTPEGTTLTSETVLGAIPLPTVYTPGPDAGAVKLPIGDRATISFQNLGSKITVKVSAK